MRLLHKQIRDLLVIDVDGDTSAALALAARAHEVLPQTPELVFVQQGNVTAAVGAIKAGAADCLERPPEAARLACVLDDLLNARVRRLREVRRMLTPTELTVLRHILEGRTSPTIARTLHRSRRTIDVHRRRVMRKLGVSNLVGLVKWAVQEGFFDREEDRGRTDA
jgi:FixJ family two-component response regulator